MRIEVKGRNVAVSDELRERIEKRFEKIAKQVSPMAQLDVWLTEEKKPSLAKQAQIAEVTLHLKGVTLRARDASTSIAQSVNKAADDLARQVKKHRDKRRGRRESAAAKMEAAPTEQPAAP